MASSCENCNFKSKHQYPPVRIEQLYSYHAPLNGSELEKHLRILHDEEEDVKDYAAEISRLRGTLEKLVEEKDALERKICDRRTLTSALRRIPTEIWVRIFSLSGYVDHTETVPSSDVKEREERERALNAQFNTSLRLSHVCSRWRAIALNAPEVWTSICINLYSPDAVGLLELYLTHSKGRETLDVIIWDYGIADPRNRANVHHGRRLEKGARAFQRLMSAENTARFRSLTILMTSDRFRLDRTRSPLHESPALFFSRLEYLHITSKLPQSGYPAWLWQGLRQAPKLNEACIGSVIGFETVTNDRLRALHIEPVGHHSLLSSIPNLPHLESLSVRDTQLTLHRPLDPPVRCQTLRDLRIVYTNGNRHASGHNLLLSLDIPNLRSLDLHFQQSEHFMEALSTLSPLHALRSSLQKLSLTLKQNSTHNDISKFLTWLPNIVELELNSPDSPTWFDTEKTAMTELLQDIIHDASLGKQLQRVTLVAENHSITNELVSMCVRFLEAKRAWSVDTQGKGGSMITYFCLVGLLQDAQPLADDLDLVDRLEVLASQGPTQCIITNRERSLYFFPR
ncbi:hypothetical protein V5O48_008505 [Marasmius crinis-equi]|uniref:F-box domain-containing protein n=1 Tax=Marasmius crinis-equi TaxID=585013 RepID=A0ABR3FDR2_9AGAR